MIHLFTDFGWAGPYVGEMKSVLARELGQAVIVDLMHDAPACNPRASAYLLAALCRRFQRGDVCLAVVDPGVGNDARRGLIVDAGGVRYVGPDNGLFAILARDSGQIRCREILWRADNMSSSFHGRDWFAPVVSRLVREIDITSRDVLPGSMTGQNWPQQLDEVIYIDRYGNAITGLRASECSQQGKIAVAGQVLQFAQTFSSVETGSLFWYANSMGLVEIAANTASAADRLGLEIGTRLSFQ